MSNVFNVFATLAEFIHATRFTKFFDEFGYNFRTVFWFCHGNCGTTALGVDWIDDMGFLEFFLGSGQGCWK